MLPDRVSNPGPLTYESGALLIALRGPALKRKKCYPEIFPEFPEVIKLFSCSTEHEIFPAHKC